MGKLPPNPALARLVKPTLDTPFHIDYGWWEKQDLDINVQMIEHLPPDMREAYANQPLEEKIDLIDWETGEVQRVEGLRYVIAKQCQEDPGYIMQAPTLVEAIFRTFLSNGNRPLTPRSLAPLVGRRPERILRVLAGRRVRKGLRPVWNT
jgi:hypothetical protein